MSKLVDERVVEMSFDNKKFEENVGETLGTISKLKQALNFDDVDKSFGEIETAANDVSFDEFEDSVDKIGGHFSAIEEIAVGVFRSIGGFVAEKAAEIVQSVAGMVASVTTNLGTLSNLSGGWSKYDEYTQAVQSLVNSTGRDVDDIEHVLSRLMTYADETSFSFTEMVNALSQASLVGADLETATDMIIGIANATAYAGKEGFAFQSTIRNLMQSYGSGYLQYIDYKSLVGQGTATEELQKQIIKAAEELGTIQVGEIDASNFKDKLKDAWATQEVMELAFSRFGEMTYMAEDMVNEGVVDNFTDAYDLIQEMNSGLEQYQIRAAIAGQEAISFGMAVDSTVEAVQTRLLKVFEFIFGNYEEAKELWTDLVELLYDIHVAKYDDLIDTLELWHDGIDGAKSGRDWFFEGIYGIFEAIGNVIDKVKEAWREIFPKRDIEETAARLTTISMLFKLWTDRLNKFVSEESRLERIGSIVKGFASILSIVKTTLSAVFSIISAVFGAFSKGSKSSGFLFDTILGGLALVGDFLTIVAEKWADLVDSFVNGKAFQSFLSFITEKVSYLKGVISGFFSALWPKIQNALAVIGKGALYALGGVLYGIGYAIKFVWDKLQALYSVLSTLFSMIWPKIKEFIDTAWQSALYGITVAIAAVGGAVKFAWDEIVKFYTMLVEKLKPVLDTVSEALNKFKSSVGEAWSKVGDSAGSAWDRLKEVIEKIKTELKALWDSIKTAFTSKIDTSVFDPIVNALKKFWNALTGGGEQKEGKEKKSGLMGVISSIWDFLKIAIPAIAELLGTLANSLFTNVSKLFTEGDVAQTLEGLNAGLGTGVLAMLLKIFKNLGDATAGLGKIGADGGPIKNLIGAIKEFLGLNDEESGLKTLADSVLKIVAAILIMSLIPGDKLSYAVTQFGLMIGAMALLIKGMGVLDAAVVNGLAKGFSSIGTAVLEMAAALFILSKIDPDTLWGSVLAMGALMAELGGFVTLIGLLDQKLSFGLGVFADKGFGKTLKAIGMTLIMIATAMLIVGQIPSDRIWDVVGAMGAIFLALTMLMAVVEGFAGDGKKLSGMALAFITLGGLIDNIVAVLLILTLVNEKAMDKAFNVFSRIVELMALLLLATGLAAKLGGEDIALVAVGVLGFSTAIDILAMTLIKLAIAVKLLGSDTFVTAGVVLGVLTLALAAFFALFVTQAPAIQMIGIGILSFGAGILALSAAISLLVVTLGTLAAAGSVILVGAQALVSVLIEIIKGLLQGIIDLAPLFVKALVTLVVGSIVTLINELGLQVAQLVAGLVVILMELIRGLNDALEQKAPNLGTELGRTLFIILKAAFDALKELAKRLWESVKSFFSGASEGTEEGLEGVQVASSGIGGNITKLVAKIKSFAEKVKEIFTAVWEWVQTYIIPFATSIFESVKTAIEFLLPFIAQLFEFVVNAVTTVLPLVMTLGQAIINLITTILTTLTNIVNYLTNDVKKGEGEIIEFFDQLDVIFTNLLITIVNVLRGGLPAMIQLGIELVGAFLDGAVSLLDRIVQFAFDIIIAILEGINNNIYRIVTIAGDIVVNFLNGIADKLPDIIEAGFNLVLSFIEGIIDALRKNKERIKTDFSDLMIEIATTVLEAMKQLAIDAWEKAKEVFQKIWDGFSEKFPGIAEWLEEKWESIKETFADLGPKIKEKAKEIINKIQEGFLEKVQNVVLTMQATVESIKSKITEKWNDFKQAGSDLIQGIIDGIQSMIQAVINKVTEVANSVLNTLKSILGIDSPSKITRQYGEYLDEGLALGMGDMMGAVTDSAEEVGDEALDAMRESLEAVAELAGEDVEYTPTIRPVYDLTSLYTGADEINSLLDSEQASINFKMGDTEAIQDVASEISENNTTMQSAIDKAYTKLTDFMTKVKDEFGDNTVTLNVYGTEGQDVEELADIVSYRINAALQRERAVYS